MLVLTLLALAWAVPAPAAAAGPEGGLEVVDSPIVVVDPASTNAGSAIVGLRNNSRAPVTVSLKVGDFSQGLEAPPVGAKTAVGAPADAAGKAIYTVTIPAQGG